MSKEQFDYFNEEWTEENDELMDDEEFIESFSSKQRYRKQENVNDLTYAQKEVIDVYIYPLYTLNGKKITDGLRVSKDKITIMATTVDKVIAVRAYLSNNEDYDLVETMDPANPLEQLMRVSDVIDFYTDQIKEVDFGYLYLLTKEKITEDNFTQVKQYLGKIITPGIDETGMEMSFSSLEEFSSSFKTSPIRVVLSEPIRNKIKEIHVTSPKGTLIGNIKPVDENGRFPELLSKEGTEIFPKLCFPFQTSPVLSLVDYWSSDQIISLNDIFEFLDSKNIKYNDSFSLQDFLKLGEDGDYPKIYYENVKDVTYAQNLLRQGIKFEHNISTANPPFICTAKITDQEISTQDKIAGGAIFEEGIKPKIFSCNLGGHGTVTPSSIVASTKMINVSASITRLDVNKKSTGFENILKMLTESFWKDYEFEGATKLEIKDGQQIEEINDWDIFKLSQKYAGQDRYAVTTNLWLSWKKINQEKVNTNLNMVKRIENTLTMLSGSLKSNFSINKGDNDDYKILLPYYFELQNSIDNPVGYVKYSDIIVKLKSNYFDFTENGIKIKDNCISKNLIHKLEYNHYAFPEMTNVIETASIPSSMPLDQQSANGEYSKYQVKCFTNQLVDIEKIKNHYGNGSINFNPLSNNKIINNGKFDFEESVKLEEIKLSAFYGYGLWRINLIDIDNNSFKLDFKLFDKNDSTISFINLIL